MPWKNRTLVLRLGLVAEYYEADMPTAAVSPIRQLFALGFFLTLDYLNVSRSDLTSRFYHALAQHAAVRLSVRYTLVPH